MDTWIADPATGKLRQATQEEADAMRARADAKRFGCLPFLGAVVVAAFAWVVVHVPLLWMG